jgi:hypothetical protein
MSASDMDDVVTRAARSLRAAQDAAIAGGPDAFVPVDPTWSRIARDVRRGRERRRMAAVIAVQLAIGLGAVGVWAAVSKRLTPVAPPPAVPVQPACEPPPVRHRSSAIAAPAVEPRAPERETAPAPRRSAPARVVAHLDANARAATTATQVGHPEAEAASLYRDAHELHFVRRDFARALAAWDRYLLASGPLAIEARYNRAIALAHLGRCDEAVAALHPFADGALGSYRQAEARALIDKLRSD